MWNKNTINRAPVYCNIGDSLNAISPERSLTLRLPSAIRFQVALNVAAPACSLCINRQLYRVARMKTLGTTDAENRRIVIIDLLIGVGIPILQMIMGECA